MSAFKSFPRQWLWGGLMLLAVASARADDAPPKPDSSLEIIQYKTPAGWQASDRPGQAVRTIVTPDSNASEQALILILLSPAQDPMDFRATFDAGVKELTSKGKILESSEVTASKTRQGFEALSQTVVTQGEGDKRLYMRMIAAKVQNRMAGIYYLATTKKLYDLHQPEMDALLQSVSFKIGDAGGNPAAVKAEIDALEKQKQELLKKVAEIDARERQLAAGIQGGAPPANDEQLLIKASERFAREAGGRRKPHTILGDILGVDGKPIPNVEVYRVFVWGTTIAAEKAHYGLEVDAKGHFEQQVPDGLYQIKASCIVKHAGHRVPVDLAWLDDKKVGVDQASAGGIVRDFCLAVTGLKAGEDPKGANSYYGGGFTVNGPNYDVTRGHLSTRHPNSRVLVTLTPQGPVIDGSQREPITIDMDVVDLNYGTHPPRVPLGAYRLTATLVGKDGSKQALQCSRNAGAEYATSADVFWECSRDNQEDRVDPIIYLKD